MKVIACGGRTFKDEARIRSVLSAFHSGQPIAWLGWCGSAGVASEALAWAKESGVRARILVPPSDMHDLVCWAPDVVLAFPGGKGTAGTVKIARAVGVEVLIITESQT